METFIESPALVEAARVATVKAVEGSESVYGRWVAQALAVKKAWPTKALCNEALLVSWIISGLSKAERESTTEGYVEGFSEAAKAAKAKYDSAKDDDEKTKAAQVLTKAEVAEAEAKVFRVATQNKVSQYKKRAVERAYPVIVAPVEKPMTPAQISAEAAQKAAKAASVEWIQSATEAGNIKAEAAIKGAEAKLAETKAKAAEAKAKLDPTKAAEAEALKAQAEAEKAQAEALKAKVAEADEETKAKAAIAKAAQEAANEEAAAIRLANKIAKVIGSADDLILKAGELEGAEGLVDFMTALRNTVSIFKALNI